VWAPAAVGPTHFSFLDQHRLWLRNGTRLAPDSPTDGESPEIAHAEINEAYHAMLHAIGLDRWVDEMWKDADGLRAPRPSKEQQKKDRDLQRLVDEH
jgi:hypothetical protein